MLVNVLNIFVSCNQNPFCDAPMSNDVFDHVEMSEQRDESDQHFNDHQEQEEGVVSGKYILVRLN